MKIGYIRVSRDKQTTALQEDAMRKERCERVLTDKMSGKRFDRPEFLKILDIAHQGDVIVVWRRDCLGRFLKVLIETVTLLSTMSGSPFDLIPSCGPRDNFTFASILAYVTLPHTPIPLYFSVPLHHRPLY